MDAAQNFNRMLAMRVFVRVVEAGTFTNAANSLRMPKPTVTKLVQSLENHLRIKLLNRTTRRVTVTPDGSAYYERVVRLLGDLDEIESSVTHAKERPRGRLRIDAGAAVTSFIILLEPSLVARHVGDLRWLTCATHGYFQKHARPTHPTDLESGHTLAGYFFPRSGRMRPLIFERDGKRIEIAPNPRVAVNDSAAHLWSLRAGLGLGQIISFMVSANDLVDEFVPVLQDLQPEPLAV